MSKKALKLLERMRQTRAGWRAHDFQTLYLGFGFRVSHGGNHDTYIHPDFPDIRDQIPRHSEELPKAYARTAVEKIDLLLQRQKEVSKDDE